VSDESMRPLLDVSFGSYLLRRPMIKMLGHYRRASISDVILGVVSGSLVICTNTYLVHPTWLAGAIPVIFVSDVSMRPYLMLILVLICCNIALDDVYFLFSSFCEHAVIPLLFRCLANILSSLYTKMAKKWYVVYKG
jgi:hypothetical protein